MSSPVNENLDKRYMYAPPWAREAPQQYRQSTQAIVAAVERLMVERQRAAAPAAADDSSPESEELQQRDDSQQELPLVERDVADIEAAMADMVRTGKWTPRSLDPVTMPEPPKPRLDGPTWGMVARMGGAVSAAAVLALVVTGYRAAAVDRDLVRSRRKRKGRGVRCAGARPSRHRRGRAACFRRRIAVGSDRVRRIRAAPVSGGSTRRAAARRTFDRLSPRWTPSQPRRRSRARARPRRRSQSCRSFVRSIATSSQASSSAARRCLRKATSPAPGCCCGARRKRATPTPR